MDHVDSKKGIKKGRSEGGGGEGARVAARRVNVLVRAQTGDELKFRVKGTTEFRKVANAWCTNRGVSLGTVRFHSEEGTRLELDKTIDELGLDEDDIQGGEDDDDEDCGPQIYVNAFMEQVGGGALEIGDRGDA